MAISRSLVFAPAFALALSVAAAPAAWAQEGGRAGGQGRGCGAGPAGPPPTARAQAPKDFTGTWVSVVTEHWHLRMLVPPKGDYSMLPLTPAARKIADAYDPAKDVAEGGECKPYGPPALMRTPGRIRISWADDNTLQLDSDSGQQTRYFRFPGSTPPATTPAAAQWQGNSVAAWVDLGGRGRGAPPKGTGQLRVRTTGMRPGYLRRNGVPYSEKASLEEYFDTFTEPNGDTWLVVTAITTDPQNLTQPYPSTVPFRKIADREGWDPTPCRLDEPR